VVSETRPVLVNDPCLRGELYLPSRETPPWPGMVILNSSAGICDARERYYARFLAGHGMAALAVDSFGPRGIVETMTDQSRIADQDMERDAYAAFDRLAADPRIDSGRIGVMGVSRGGLAALHTGLLARRAWFSRPASDFAVRIALVPPGHMQQRDARTDGRPMLILLAGRDDYVGTEPALAYAARLTDVGGGDIRTKVYRDAHHAWERTGPPIFLEKAENYSRCRLYVEDDATLTDARTGRRLTLPEFFNERQRHITLGGHVGGGTDAFKAGVAEDILRFLVPRIGQRRSS